MITLARDLATRALEPAKVPRATDADARFVHGEVEVVFVRNGILEAVTRSDAAGVSVRAIADGAWGFAASQVLTAAEVDQVAALAVAIAKASALVKEGDVRLAETTP